MPVVLLKSAKKQIQESLRSFTGSVGRSSSFSDNKEPSSGRPSSFGYERSRQSSFERLNQSGPVSYNYGTNSIADLSSDPTRLRTCSVVDELSREYEDYEGCEGQLSPSSQRREPIKKPKKEPDGDTRMHFHGLFNLRSFGASKSPSPNPERDDSSSHRLTDFFRRRRESNDSLTGSTASDEMRADHHRAKFFFRKKSSDISNTSGEEEEDWPRSLGLFGGGSSSSHVKKSSEDDGDGKEQHQHHRKHGGGVRKCLSVLKRHASGSSHGSAS